MTQIKLQNITKIFNNKVIAVKNLDLLIPDKKLTCLLGPSGCGKTTTLRIIAGIESPSTGNVYFDDEEVTALPARQRNVAMVFQFPAVYPNLNVRKNIILPLKAEKVSENEANRRIKEVSQMLGIEEILDKMPGSLDASGRQKVALARAIVRKARAYLLDEPLTNLDPKGRVEMKLLIKKLSAEIGQTIVYVTHDQSEAMTLADKIAVMKDGELKQYDSPENIYLKPSDTFVAWFIGNPGMNFIETTLKEDGERVYLDAGPFKYDVTYMKDAIKEIPVEAIMGIRPEHIEVSREKLGNYWLEGTCTLIEPLGGRQLLHIDVGGIELKAKISPFTSVASGEKIWVLFPQQFIRIFDKKNKKLMWP